MENDESPLMSVAETLNLRGAPRGKKRLKWLIILIILLAVCVSSALAVKKMDRPDSVRYKTQEVERGNLTVTVTATGTLEPTNQVEVGSELSGTIREVMVEENSRVSVNQVLAKLDTTKLEAQYLESKAELASAEAKVLQARATSREAANNLTRLKHVRQLSNNKVPSQYDLDTAEATLARARADEASAKADVSKARAALKVTETDLSKIGDPVPHERRGPGPEC
jgi:HlyD family secretion protein